MNQQSGDIISDLETSQVILRNNVNAKSIITFIYPIVQQIGLRFPQLAGADKHKLAMDTLYDIIDRFIKDRDEYTDARYAVQQVGHDYVNNVISASHQKYNFDSVTKKQKVDDLTDDNRAEIINRIMDQFHQRKNFDIKNIRSSDIITITRQAMELVSIQRVQGYELPGVEKSKIVDGVVSKVIQESSLADDDKANVAFLYQLTADTFKANMVDASREFKVNACCVLV